MDADRFDAWTVAVGTAANRRVVVHALATGAGVGGLLALRGEAAAACKKEGRKCTKRKHCCSKLCKGKKGKKRCRCFKAQTPCPIGDQAKCCGSLVCGQNACAQGGVCCRGLGDVGCSEACDCCTDNAGCQNGRCCLPLGAPCQMAFSDKCCSGLCVGNSCAPPP